MTEQLMPPPLPLDELDDDELLLELDELDELDELLLEVDDDDELELLLEELLELDELELLDDELELLPLQSAACGLLPATSRLSILPRPSLVVACKRTAWLPADRFRLTDTVLQVVHEPVDGNDTFATTLPSTITCPERSFEEPFA